MTQTIAPVRRASRRLFGVGVPMRDGVRLATDLHFPRDGDDRPRPALLMRTPYGR